MRHKQTKEELEKTIAELEVRLEGLSKELESHRGSNDNDESYWEYRKIEPNTDQSSEVMSLKKYTAELEKKLALLDAKNDYKDKVSERLPTDVDFVNEAYETEYPEYLKRLDEIEHRFSDTHESGGTLPKGFGSMTEKEPAQSSGGIKVKHIVIIGMVFMVGAGFLAIAVSMFEPTQAIQSEAPVANTVSPNRDANVISYSKMPSAYENKLIESATTPIDYGGLTDSQLASSQKTISEMNDCDQMTDMWVKNTGWTLRPELAAKILEECY